MKLCQAVTDAAATFTCAATIPGDDGPKGAHRIVAKAITSLMQAATTFSRT